MGKETGGGVERGVWTGIEVGVGIVGIVGIEVGIEVEVGIAVWV